eukprot:2156755-Pleurochrysis_carterae.AAC.1
MGLPLSTASRKCWQSTVCIHLDFKHHAHRAATLRRAAAVRKVRMIGRLDSQCGSLDGGNG